jgi:hypothetical protein
MCAWILLSIRVPLHIKLLYLGKISCYSFRDANGGCTATLMAVLMMPSTKSSQPKRRRRVGLNRSFRLGFFFFFFAATASQLLVGRPEEW